MTETNEATDLNDPEIVTPPDEVAMDEVAMDAPAEAAPSPVPPPGGEIVAVGSNDYRFRRYIMVALLLAFGGWFAYDGWVKYPRVNDEIDTLQRQQLAARDAGDREREVKLSEQLKSLGDKGKPLGLFFQKTFAVICPILAFTYLGWTFYRSRGEYRLTDEDVLHAPGHPPVPLDQLTAVRNPKWDRKGIADLDYALDGGKSGTVRLDDFIYQRPPIDAIYDRALARMGEGV